MNIIIPIGGIGQRFKDEGYDMPKPLINVLGKPMIYNVISNLEIDYSKDKIHIVYHNHLKEFNFETLVKFNISSETSTKLSNYERLIQLLELPPETVETIQNEVD